MSRQAPVPTAPKAWLGATPRTGLLNMRSKTLKLVLAVMGLAVIGLLLRQERQQQQSRQEVERLQTELSAMKASGQRQADARDRIAGDNRALLAAVSSLQKTVDRRRQANPPTEEPGGLDPDAEPRDAPRPPPITYEQSQAAVLAAYAKEAPDATWSRDAERKLDAVVRPHLPSGSRLSALECRNTMCRVEVVHSDPSAEATFLMEAFRGWPGSRFVAGEKEDHGALLITIIAAREGTEPPIAPR